jgi:catechol 2,3-dioxygenase-like lactoylglutathione lyase family enzyme
MVPMNPPQPSSALHGTIRQIGYIVHDLDAAIDSWVRMGIGPWFKIARWAQDGVYRGAAVNVQLSVALANSGDLQIELIQQHDDTPSIYSEFLDSGAQGFNQLAFWVDDFDAALADATAAGYPVVWTSGEDAQTRFAYVEADADQATIFEIMELTPAAQAMADIVRRSAVGWDGSRPVRSMMEEMRNSHR